MESSKQVERLHINEADDIEISCTILAVEYNKGSIDELIQKIATSINVQLALEEENQEIPFIPFNGFDNIQHEDKLFLYGPSGCGKSRGIFEIIKRTIIKEKEKEIKNIYIINPRRALENESIKRAKLYELVNKFHDNDIVIWDNFPDGLVKKDLDSAQNVLEIISSKNVESLYLSLKPKYLEMYRDIAAKTAEICRHEVSYDKQKIKTILKSYGTGITSFKELYQKYLINDLDKIAKILWQKEPTPLTVIDFYKELSSNNSSSTLIENEDESIEKKEAVIAISTAEKLLLSTEYYEHQFTIISNSEERRGDAEFLYTLKLCYELELERTIDVIRAMQKEIFGTASPKKPLQKLTTWLYLSSQYYSMHDLCKDAIKFNDDIRLKIISHLTENFMNIIPIDNDSSTYSFGIFYGKNFEFVPRNNASNLFLPAHVYGYMKSKRHFAKGLAHGIGEIFPLLDEQLQEQILKRIEIDEEFAESFGESIGANFASLDDMQQKQMLFDYKNKSAPFANGLGEGLGYNLKSIPSKLQKQIFELCFTDAMFAQGFGKGLGRNFKNLSDAFQKQIFAWTEDQVYGNLRQGLGIGIGRSFVYLDKQLQQEILRWAESDREFGQGLGYGLGYDFPSRDKQIQEKIFAVAGQNSRFASGLAAALAFNFAYLDRRVQEDLLKRAEKDHTFASGLGDGFGIVFFYLDKELQLDVLTQANQNGAMAWGLGQSLGLRFKYIPKEFQKELFKLAKKNIGFTRGFATGLGDAFSELNKVFQKELFDKAEKDSEFAFGFGAGIGSWHMDNKIWKEVLAKAEKNSQFARGLAQSLVIYLTFLDKERKEIVLKLAEKDGAFAFGWGRGFGIIFMVNSRNDVLEEFRKELFEHLKKNSQFARGLGSALGLHSQYLSIESRNELFRLAQQNIDFAYGLGDGLGRAFTYLEETLQKDLFRLAEQNVQFATGLGSGLGYSFMYLRKQFQDNVFELAEQNLQLAQGLGEGLGISFSYLAEDIQIRLIEKLVAEGINSAFARGFGEGLGRNFSYLSKTMQAKVLRKADENMQLRIGLGCGFGLVFPYLQRELRIKLFEMAEDIAEDGYAKGLGIGLGRIFNYLNIELQSEFFKYVKGLQHSPFVRGLGFGLGLQFKYLNKEAKDRVFKDAQKNAHFAEGLGEGIGYTFSYLGERLQEEAFGKSLEVKKETNGNSFAYGLGKGIAYVLAYLPPQIYAKIIVKTYQNKEFAKGLGEGLGHIFPSLKEEVQEKVFLWTDERTSQEFVEGVGIGLGGSFKYLEDILQQEILLSRLMEKETGFVRALAFELGNNFPSLDEKLQNELLEYAQNNNKFAKGLGLGLSHSFNYLGSELQTQILALTERSEQFAMGLREQDNAQERTTVSQTQSDFPIIGCGLRWKSDLTPYDYSNKKTLVPSTEHEEISFVGVRENYCICYIDMINSTRIAASLGDMQISKYYAIFLNSIAIIARNFGAKIIKNAGDSLIFYFPQTSLTNVSSNDNSNKKNNNSNTIPIAPFKDVIECCLTMVAAHRAINAKLHLEQLPPLNYRISADYGKVEVAKSATSQSEDLFGSTMNLCAKINSKAAPNSIVIGNNLYILIRSLDNNEMEYTFEKVGEYSGLTAATSSYPVYSVQTKEKRTILNPFKRTSTF